MNVVVVAQRANMTTMGRAGHRSQSRPEQGRTQMLPKMDTNTLPIECGDTSMSTR